MMYLSESEWLLWGGVSAMFLAVVLAIICLVTFHITGRKIKKKLEQEYGKPQR